eukprot:TRINITY_DN73337_c0_g1_i1.p1 TRINITY_DN73337_c0_g1~~TRINITY_DN73337_c0_g1_i1.p1  ORF type:complete len:614 (+),score=112.76 TRINITY_DN73337_c0_g1_i1:59-1843(+)
MTATITSFVEALISSFGEAGYQGEESAHFDAASGQLVLEGSTTQVVPVAALFPAYASCADAAARARLVAGAVQAFAGGSADVPADLAECGERLLPQLWPVEKIGARQATLPSGFDLPHCGLHGEEPPLERGEGLKQQLLGVVLVIDFAPDGVLPPIETPVLSKDLLRWGIGFGEALSKALENLRVRTKKGLAVEKRWEHHPSGCAQSAQCDRFDAARCALFPRLVAARKRAEGAPPEEGGQVVAFGTSSCVLAATSRNALGLCFMGDVLHLQLPTSGPSGSSPVLLCTTPFRLMKMRDSAAGGEAALRHPLCQKAGEGFVWRWLPYVPGGPPLKATGEFSVPEDQAEVDAILAAAEKGMPVPVFSRKPAGSPADKASYASSASDYASRKDAANALFKSGDFVKALAAYDAALAAGPPGDAEAAVLHANASQALLRLAEQDEPRRLPCAAEAMKRAVRATELDPTYAKAYARCAAACDILGEPAAAAEARAKAESCLAAEAATKNAKRREAEETRKAEQERRAAIAKSVEERKARDALLARERALEEQKSEKEGADVSAHLASMLGIDASLAGVTGTCNSPLPAAHNNVPGVFAK